MVFNDFAILSANIMTISHKLFVKNLSEMAASIEVESAEQAPGDHAAMSNYLSDLSDGLADTTQKSVDDAYDSIADCERSFRRAYQTIDHEALASALDKLGSAGVALHNRLTLSTIDLCVLIFSKGEYKEPFESLRSLIDSAFHDPTEDLVSQAVANNDVAVLQENSQQIVSDSIPVEDIEICVMCEKIDVFKWLVSKRKLNGDELLSVMKNADDDPEYFYGVLHTIQPEAAELSRLVSHYADDETISYVIKLYSDGE